MTYATPQDLIDLYGADRVAVATNWDNPGNSDVDMEILQKHCEMASGLMDITLMRRFTLPIDFTIVPQAEAALRSIALAFIWASINPTEANIEAKDKAQELLDNLVTRKAGFGGDGGKPRQTAEEATPGIQPNETRPPSVNFGVPPRISRPRFYV